MSEKEDCKKVGFIGKIKEKLGALFSSLDKKLEEKSKETPCCKGKDSNGSSCC